MHLTFHPQRLDARLSVTRQGDTLILNDTPLDFSDLAEGALLPAETIDNRWIAGDVERIDGTLHIALIVPHGARAPQDTLFPAPRAVSGDGPVDLPPYETE